MQYGRKLLLVLGCGLLAPWVGQAQNDSGGDPHVRWAAPVSQALSAEQRFAHCDLARAVSDRVIAPQRVRDWIDSAFFVPVRSVESLTERLPAVSAREDVQLWLRDARIEQQSVVRLLRGTPPSARPGGVDLWRVPIRLSHLARIARDDDGEIPLGRADFGEFLNQPDQRGGLDSLGRQMLAATLTRVVRLNPQQREQCQLNACELRILVKTSLAPNGFSREAWLADVQLWAQPSGGSVRISIPNVSADGQDIPNAADTYLSEQAKTMVCVVPPAFRR